MYIKLFDFSKILYFKYVLHKPCFSNKDGFYFIVPVCPGEVKQSSVADPESVDNAAVAIYHEYCGYHKHHKKLVDCKVYSMIVLDAIIRTK